MRDHASGQVEEGGSGSGGGRRGCCGIQGGRGSAAIAHRVLSQSLGLAERRAVEQRRQSDGMDLPGTFSLSNGRWRIDVAVVQEGVQTVREFPAACREGSSANAVVSMSDL